MGEKNLSCVDAECVGNDSRVRQLADLLTAAQMAHEAWEADARLAVATDDGPEALAGSPLPYTDWQHWYAQYMLDNGAGLILCEVAKPHVHRYPGDTVCDVLCGDSLALDG